jgi:hypothetical protein
VAGGRLHLCKDNMLLANAQVSPNIACAVDRQGHEGLGNNFLESEPRINILTKRDRTNRRAPCSL